MSIRSIKITFLIAVLLLSFSCGKDKEQEVKDAILSANIYLSTKQCQPAIDLLESMGRQNQNARYLKTLSSAYACRAGYSTVSFFGDDIKKTVTPSPLGGVTTYNTSVTTSTAPLTDDLNFRDLQTAIDILLYAGGIPTTSEPTSVLRDRYFNANQAGDINTQLVFMMLVQTGKFMKVYADADATGTKGGGSAGNNCFTDYSNLTVGLVQAALAAQQGACTVATSSHSQLKSSNLTVAERRKRLCEGVVLINGVLDILPSVVASVGGSELNGISGLTTDIETGKTALRTAFPAIGSILTVLSQKNCETDPAITTETIESYYAVIVEALIE